MKPADNSCIATAMGMLLAKMKEGMPNVDPYVLKCIVNFLSMYIDEVAMDHSATGINAAEIHIRIPFYSLSNSSVPNYYYNDPSNSSNVNKLDITSWNSPQKQYDFEKEYYNHYMNKEYHAVGNKYYDFNDLAGTLNLPSSKDVLKGQEFGTTEEKKCEPEAKEESDGTDKMSRAKRIRFINMDVDI